MKELSPDWPAIERRPVHRGDLFETLRVTNVLRTSGVMVRREVFDRIGGFDHDLTARHDWDLWLRIARDYLIDFIPEIAVRYHYGMADQLSYRSRAVVLGQRDDLQAATTAARGAVERSATHLALQSRELLALGKRRLAARYALRSLALQPSQPISRRVLKQLLKHGVRRGG